MVRALHVSARGRHPQPLSGAYTDIPYPNTPSTTTLKVSRYDLYSGVAQVCKAAMVGFL